MLPAGDLATPGGSRLSEGDRPVDRAAQCVQGPREPSRGFCPSEARWRGFLVRKKRGKFGWKRRCRQGDSLSKGPGVEGQEPAVV